MHCWCAIVPFFINCLCVDFAGRWPCYLIKSGRSHLCHLCDRTENRRTKAILVLPPRDKDVLLYIFYSEITGTINIYNWTTSWVLHIKIKVLQMSIIPNVLWYIVFVFECIYVYPKLLVKSTSLQNINRHSSSIQRMRKR